MVETPGQANGVATLIEAPIEHRIDEILQFMVDNDPDETKPVAALISSIRERVEGGG